MKTKVTAVIPSLYEKDAEYLQIAVESLRATTDWDIVVVTNGGRYKPDLSHIKGITVHIHTRDQGQCNAVNIGAQLSAPNTDYLFVSNSDMYFAPGWNRNLFFGELMRCFSPNLIEPIDNAGSAKPFLKLDGGISMEAFKPEVVDEFVADYDPLENQPLHEIGFNFPFFIQKQVWDVIGGYDIAYDPWGSNGDTDLQTKIELAGITPMRMRDMLVYHFSNKSGTFDGTHQDFWQHNWDYYTQKWGFNRNDTKGDPWYCKNMIDRDKLKYYPDWKGRFAV